MKMEKTETMESDKPLGPDTSKFYTASDLSLPTSSLGSGCFGSLTAWVQRLFAFSSSAPRSSSTSSSCKSSMCRLPAPAPSLFPEWTPAELSTLITRWTNTYPGPLTHPQNVGISSLISLIDSGSATAADAATLHASLVHRLRMDHSIEMLARELGLFAHELDMPAIEEFEPPPASPMSVGARRLLQLCTGDWVERVMPLPDDGVRVRYRKPKYWIVALMAKAGWSPEVVDVCLTAWFEERGHEMF